DVLWKQLSVVPDQRTGEVQRHRRVVRPGPGWQPAPGKRELRQRQRDLVGSPELEGCAEGVADREPDQRTGGAILQVRHFAPHASRSVRSPRSHATTLW